MIYTNALSQFSEIRLLDFSNCIYEFFPCVSRIVTYLIASSMYTCASACVWRLMVGPNNGKDKSDLLRTVHSYVISSVMKKRKILLNVKKNCLQLHLLDLLFMVLCCTSMHHSRYVEDIWQQKWPCSSVQRMFIPPCCWQQGGHIKAFRSQCGCY